MADMTLNEVREGLALAIKQKNAEGIQLFTNIYSAMETKKNTKTPMENFNRQLGLTARYVAEPYELPYNAVSSMLEKINVGDGRTLPEAYPSIYQHKPETEMEKFVSYPSRAVSYTAMPLGVSKLSQGVGNSLLKNRELQRAPKSFLSKTPETGLGRVLDATGKGLKKGFLSDPRRQLVGGATFGLGAAGASQIDTPPELDTAKEVIGGVAATLFRQPTQNLLKNTLSNLKGNVTKTTPKIINKTNDIINSSLKSSGVTLDELPTEVALSLKSLVNEAVKNNTNISPVAIKKLIDYKLSGATPTIGRINSNTPIASREAKKTAEDQELFSLVNKNKQAFRDTIDDMGAGNAKEVGDYSDDLAKSLQNVIDQTYSSFGKRYKRINNMKEGRDLKYDHVYFTNKVADKLQKSYQQFDTPPSTQKIINLFASGKEKLTLESVEMLKKNLGRKIAGSTGGEAAAYKTIRNVLDETPLIKNQRIILNDKQKLLIKELDSVRADYKAFKQSLGKDDVRNFVSKGNEIKPNFFETKVLNKTPSELSKFFNSLPNSQKLNFKNNYLNVIKNKIMSGDSINTNKLTEILNNPKKLGVVFSKQEIMKLRAIRDTAKYEKNISTKQILDRSFIEPKGKIKNVIEGLKRAENFYNIEKGLLSQEKSPIIQPFMGYSSLLENPLPFGENNE
tara:strand:+ start:2202 stop:4235 length:2034 start_codon:yes stop_codon:yes gene_type:complete